MQQQEDLQFLALLSTTVANNLTANPAASSSSGCDKLFLNDLSATIMVHDLPCYGYLMQFGSFKDIRSWDNTDLDPVTMRRAA